MLRTRLLPRLDIKGPHLVKGVHLEGLRKVGDPRLFAQRYYEAGADELIYMDIVASLYGRNNLSQLIQETASNVLIPITVGGGLRSVDDVATMLRSGADKVAINTAATQRPELITEVAQRYGSQCMVLSIEAQRRQVEPEAGQLKPGQSKWEARTDNGREHTHRDVVAWAIEGVERGAGEILLTSIDQEGTRRGFDVELVKAVATAVPVPVIACGGMGSLEHLSAVLSEGQADAVAMADVLHYERLSLADCRAVAAPLQLQPA